MRASICWKQACILISAIFFPRCIINTTRIRDLCFTSIPSRCHCSLFSRCGYHLQTRPSARNVHNLPTSNDLQDAFIQHGSDTVYTSISSTDTSNSITFISFNVPCAKACMKCPHKIIRVAVGHDRLPRRFATDMQWTCAIDCSTTPKRVEPHLFMEYIHARVRLQLSCQIILFKARISGYVLPKSLTAVRFAVIMSKSVAANGSSLLDMKSPVARYSGLPGASIPYWISFSR